MIINANYAYVRLNTNKKRKKTRSLSHYDC